MWQQRPGWEKQFVFSDQFVRSATLLFLLLNPFLISIYLLDLIQDLSWRAFTRVMLGGTLIGGAFLLVFGMVGDALFRHVLQVRFASFLLFGGIAFLIVGLRFFFQGVDALKTIRGRAGNVAGSIAIPTIIGPGTVSASISAGSHLPTGQAILAIVAPLIASVATICVFKRVHDLVHEQYESIVTQYIHVVGRISALVIGTIAVEMILRGIEMWLAPNG